VPERQRRRPEPDAPRPDRTARDLPSLTRCQAHHGQAEPPADLREERTRPPDPQALPAGQATSGHLERAPAAARHLRRALQPPQAAPSPGRADPRHGLARDAARPSTRPANTPPPPPHPSGDPAPNPPQR